MNHFASLPKTKRPKKPLLRPSKLPMEERLLKDRVIPYEELEEMIISFYECECEMNFIYDEVGDKINHLRYNQLIYKKIALIDEFRSVRNLKQLRMENGQH